MHAVARRTAEVLEDGRCPAREWDEVVGMSHAPHVDREAKFLAPYRLLQIVRVHRIVGAIHHRRLVGAAEEHRPALHTTSQGQQDVGFKQMHHDGVEFVEPFQDRRRLRQDERAQAHTLGKPVQQPAPLWWQVMTHRRPDQTDAAIALRVLAQGHVASHVADRGVEHESESVSFRRRAGCFEFQVLILPRVSKSGARSTQGTPFRIDALHDP